MVLMVLILPAQKLMRSSLRNAWPASRAAAYTATRTAARAVTCATPLTRTGRAAHDPGRRRLSQQDLRAMGATPGLVTTRYTLDTEEDLEERRAA
jgi:hypothetical protein